MKPLVLYRNLKYQKLFDDMERLLDSACAPEAVDALPGVRSAASAAEMQFPYEEADPRGGAAAGGPDAYECL